MKLLTYILFTGYLFCCLAGQAQSVSFVTQQPSSETFTFTESSVTIPIWIDGQDYPGAVRAFQNLLTDIELVTGKTPITIHSLPSQQERILLIGTIGKSKYIDQLIAENKIDKNELKDKNEKYIICTIPQPLPGVEEALVIAGSDKRGTIYGIYELSEQIGVSPWYYWADVPVKKQSDLYIKRGKYTAGEPAVAYRGIFLNDEEPALGGWVRSTFGGFNSQFYEKVFELILRLKGNFLWPAMWGKAFYDDDPLNGTLADEYGIVINTSHHEPMGRAHVEWERYGKGSWNYNQNKEVLQEFWRTGIERMKDFETFITIGMRGDGDEAMSEESDIALLQEIVKDQRKIISEVTGKKADKTPQVWALYKEVQDYYDNGMRVPDDVTLLLCDDNWGNVRKLPDLKAKPRKGGYGMYYHFDYVGGPRNYKWVNVSQIQRIWEQMNLTYAYGVDKIWVVNVGDLKPMEYPISFFLDMAWNPTRFTPENLLQHTEEWCIQQFGDAYGKEAARMIDTYTKHNRRVTPELLNENTYSLANYNEFERVVQEYKELVIDAMRLYYLMPEEYRDAFDQLVLFPINACCNLYEMYYAVAKNHWYAEVNDPEANYWADKVRKHFIADSLLTIHYNRDITGGKWVHMMDQVRIGYTYWQQPDSSVMPTVYRVEEKSILPEPSIFIENDGYVSIEAEHFTSSGSTAGIEWKVIPGLGKTLSGITTFPVTETPDKKVPVYLEYQADIQTTGEVTVHLYLSPTLNFNSNKGLRYGISINGEEEQVVNFNHSYTEQEREEWVANSIIESVTTHKIGRPGIQTIRFRVLDPGIVLQKLVINTGGLRDSYLGPPESKLKTSN